MTQKLAKATLQPRFFRVARLGFHQDSNRAEANHVTQRDTEQGNIGSIKIGLQVGWSLSKLVLHLLQTLSSTVGPSTVIEVRPRACFDIMCTQLFASVRAQGV